MPPKKFTVAQAEKALMAHYGNVSQAAKALGVDHSTLWNRFKREPRLQEVRMLAMESALDVAENSLLTAARNGEAWATCFLLKTIADFGIDGDAHAGKWHRQVSLISW